METPSTTGAGDTLTGPARTILTNPTFLGETTADATTAGEGTAAIDFLAGSELIPAAGAALPWVAGATAAAIGVAVACNAIIGSCVDFSAITGDPVKTKEVTWTQQGGATWFGVNGSAKSKVWVPAKSYVTTSPSAWFEDWENACGKGGGRGLHFPEEATTTLTRADDSFNCPPVTAGASTAGMRSGAKNRQVEFTGSLNPDGKGAVYSGSGYCGGSGAACTEAPPATWPEQAATCLDTPQRCGMTNTQRDHLGEHIASAIDGSHVSDPYSKYVEVPQCEGLYWTQCKTVIEESSLAPARLKVGFAGAVIEKGAGAVLELRPESDASLVKGSTVTVVTNPDEADMPVVLPQPSPGESGQHYVYRLGQLDEALMVGLVTIPVANPNFGPEVVTGVEPVAGSRVQHSAEVTVNQNPSGAATPAGAFSPPAIPSIDLTPFAGVAIGCSSFPFGIFCWIGEGLTSWGSSGTCPSFSIPFITNFSSGAEHPLEVDFCQFEPAMEIIRPVLVVLACFTLAAIFAYAALGIGGDAASGDD